MEDQVDRAELVQEMEGDRVGAWFSYHIVWAQVLVQEFLGWPSGSEELCLDIGLVTNFWLRSLCPVLVHCRQDNNLPHESFVESSSRARMCYHNHPKSRLYSIM